MCSSDLSRSRAYDLDAAQAILDRLGDIGELATATVPGSGLEQGQVELGKALGA